MHFIHCRSVRSKVNALTLLCRDRQFISVKFHYCFLFYYVKHKTEHLVKKISLNYVSQILFFFFSHSRHYFCHLDIWIFYLSICGKMLLKMNNKTIKSLAKRNIEYSKIKEIPSVLIFYVETYLLVIMAIWEKCGWCDKQRHQAYNIWVYKSDLTLRVNPSKDLLL